VLSSEDPRSFGGGWLRNSFLSNFHAGNCQRLLLKTHHKPSKLSCSVEQLGKLWPRHLQQHMAKPVSQTADFDSFTSSKPPIIHMAGD
jgi:hypothetical protein